MLKGEEWQASGEQQMKSERNEKEQRSVNRDEARCGLLPRTAKSQEAGAESVHSSFIHKIHLSP